MMIEQEFKGYEMNMKTMYSYCIVFTNTLFDSISFWPEDTLIWKGFKYLPI